MSNLKMQKVLYYLQGWNLGYFEDKLFDEFPEAWVNGPVYVSVYDKYKGYSDSAIPMDLVDSDTLGDQVKKLGVKSPQDELIEEVLDKYATLNAGMLVYKTHLEAPWLDARGGLSSLAPSRAKIKRSAMEEYFKSRVVKIKAKRANA